MLNSSQVNEPVSDTIHFRLQRQSEIINEQNLVWRMKFARKSRDRLDKRRLKHYKDNIEIDANKGQGY